MSKKNIPWKEILTTARALREKDTQCDEAFKMFGEVVFPSQYAPFFEFTLTDGFYAALKLFLTEEQLDWISYFIWEADSMTGPATVTTEDGIEYDFKKIEDATRYFEDTYGESSLKKTKLQHFEEALNKNYELGKLLTD